MAMTATVHVRLAEIEPVAKILAEVLMGGLASREMTKAAAAITHLQQAARAIEELGIVKLEPDGS